MLELFVERKKDILIYGNLQLWLMSTILISNLFQSNDVKKGDIASMCQNAWGGRRNLCLVFMEYCSERINTGYVGIDGRIILK